MDIERFRGSIVPLVTPFRNGEVDEQALSDLVDWQIASGSHGLSVTGTTGEPSALTMEERRRVIEVAVEAIDGRVPLVAGTGSNNTDETLELSRFAARAGSDALLVVVPYYNRPSQQGLFNHFKAVADAVDLPVILYNIPGRAAVNLEIDTVARLRGECDNIIGVKEANHDFAHINRLMGRLGPDFHVYSGIELLCYPILALGGAGYVSATGNVLPGEVAKLYDLTAEGEWEAARRQHFHLMELNDAMFIEINPVPAKTALGIMGRISPEVRPPLAPLAPENESRLRQVLAGYGVAEPQA